MTSPGEGQNIEYTRSELTNMNLQELREIQFQMDGNTITRIMPPGSSTVFTWNLHDVPPSQMRERQPCPVIRARLERRELEEEFDRPDEPEFIPIRRGEGRRLLREAARRL